MTMPDRLERRLPELLEELAAPRIPDYFSDTLAQTARTPQRPAWTSLERWLAVDIAARAPLGVRRFPLTTVVSIVLLMALLAAVVYKDAIRGGAVRVQGSQQARAGDEGGSREQSHEEDDRHDRHEREATHTNRCASRDVHGEPPFEGGPRRPLRCSRGLRQGFGEVVRNPRGRELFEELGEPALQAIGHGHASCPRGIGPSRVRSSLIDRRMRPSDRWSRDLAVPRGMPIDAAASGNGIPR